jgi:hypothetical protein
MKVSELIKLLDDLDQPESVVYTVSEKKDYRKASFNHRSAQLKNLCVFTGEDFGYEHMKGIFLAPTEDD